MDELGGLGELTRRWRAPLVVAAVIPVLVLLAIPFSDRPGPVVPGFVAVWCSLVLVGDLVTAALLVGLYRNGHGLRMVVLAFAYLWSGCTVLQMMFAAPGVLAEGRLLGAPSDLGWLWLSRHVGPPLLLAIAMAPWPRRFARFGAHPRPVAWSLAGLLVALPGGLLVEILLRPGALPAITNPTNATVVWWALVVVIATTSLAVVTVALGVLRRGARSGVEVWTIVAAVAWVGDALFVMMPGDRFSLSWYLARMLGVAASLIVPTSILVTTWRLQQRVSDGAQDLEARIDRLLESQRMRDHVSAVVSHDMRTPLAGLHGYLEVLVDDDGLTPDLTRRMHERSLMLTRRLTLLTEDLLAATTVEHGDLVLDPVDLDLSEQLAECATGFPDLDLRIHCPPRVHVHADPLRLQQILSNLVRNAQKHGAEPVTVTVAPPATPDGMVTVRVRDEGDGVPETFIPRLFERYSQGARASGGAGIGLSVVHDLVQAHHGTIRYDLTDPAFIVTLPASRPTVADPPAARVLSAPKRWRASA